MNLQGKSLLSSNKINQLPWVNVRLGRVAAWLGAHINPGIHTFKLPRLIKRAIALDIAFRDPTPLKRLMLNGCPLGRRITLRVMQADTERLWSTLGNELLLMSPPFDGDCTVAVVG